MVVAETWAEMSGRSCGRWRNGGRVDVHTRVLLFPFRSAVLEPDFHLQQKETMKYSQKVRNLEVFLKRMFKYLINFDGRVTSLWGKLPKGRKEEGGGRGCKRNLKNQKIE